MNFLSCIMILMVGMCSGVRIASLCEKGKDRVHVKKLIGHKRDPDSDLPFSDIPIYEEYDAELLSMIPQNEQGGYFVFLVKKDDGTIDYVTDVKFIK